MKVNEIKELLLTIDKTNLTYVNLKDNNFTLEVSKLTDIKDYKSENIKTQIQVTDVNADEVIEVEDSKQILIDDNIHLIKAPIMGTYYDSSSPESAPFIKVGDTIKKGDTLCIIEAMKLMNEITSDIDGEIIEVSSKNEDLVEYNQVLFKIKTI
jgi:acetyl-CoA carboxylase biotin carboxyl carrier protein